MCHLILLFRHTGSSSVSSFQSRNDPGYGYNTPPVHSRSPLYPQTSRHHVHLFDPEQPQYPHPMLMQTFVQIFFERFSADFPFLTYDQVCADLWDRRLPPMLSSALAAIASRSVCTHYYTALADSVLDMLIIFRSSLFVACTMCPRRT